MLTDQAKIGVKIKASALDSLDFSTQSKRATGRSTSPMEIGPGIPNVHGKRLRGDNITKRAASEIKDKTMMKTQFFSPKNY